MKFSLRGFWVAIALVLMGGGLIVVLYPFAQPRTEVFSYFWFMLTPMMMITVGGFIVVAATSNDEETASCGVS